MFASINIRHWCLTKKTFGCYNQDFKPAKGVLVYEKMGAINKRLAIEFYAYSVGGLG